MCPVILQPQSLPDYLLFAEKLWSRAKLHLKKPQKTSPHAVRENRAFATLHIYIYLSSLQTE